jgi:predicted Zn-dependent protease
VVIGVTPTDIYIRARSDWGWSFGLRADGHLAVVSTARMQTILGSLGDGA